MIRAAIGSLLLLVITSFGIGQDTLAVTAIAVPDKILKKLESSAVALAKGGRSREAFEIVEIAQGVGLDVERATKLVASCNKELAGAKAPKDTMPAEAKTIAATARELAALLPTLEGDAAKALARQILALDGSVAAAHTTLEQEKIDGRWVCSPGEIRVRRKQEIVEALRAARQLPITVTIEPSDDPFSKRVFGDRVNLARLDRVEIHSTRPPDQLARIVRETARGLAVYNFMLTGKLELPPLARRRDLWLTSLTEFKSAYDAAKEQNRLSKRDLDHPGVASSCFLDNGFAVNWDVTEAGMQATLLSYFETNALFEHDLRFAISRTQPVLRMGCLDWICRAYFGTAGPAFTWIDESGNVSVAEHSEAKNSGEEERERNSRLRMSRAGLVGARHYLAWLAARHLDPPFETCLVDEIAKLHGVELLKASSVVDWLLEQSRLAPWTDGVSLDAPDNSTSTARAMFERENGTTLTEFDRRWRDWITADDPGLIARLTTTPVELTKDERATLDLLNDMRTNAIAGNHLEEPATVTLDAELTAGCRAHVRYLTKNPTQAERWPDAHEEYPDKEGFSTAGSWAGLHGVIHAGQRAGVDAVRGWIGTFYHRLPLLDPGVVRIGYALDGGFAVLDAGSLCSTTTHDWVVVYPYEGQTNVPLAFAPELPNPKPGEDQSKWGYPITVQRRESDDAESGEAVFELRKGGPKGALVDSIVSTPAKPSNPDLAIPSVYCLIPKATLEPKTTYHVAFKPAEGAGKTWSFTTGS